MKMINNKTLLNLNKYTIFYYVIQGDRETRLLFQRSLFVKIIIIGIIIITSYKHLFFTTIREKMNKKIFFLNHIKDEFCNFQVFEVSDAHKDLTR